MINLNSIGNGADKILAKYQKKLLKEFPDEDLVGVEMGVAYGGGVEQLARIWKGRGLVYGYDTFEDLHPKHLAEDPNAFDAYCMDSWYADYGTDMLSVDYQREELEKLGFDHVTLVKGEVNKDSCRFLDRIHYAFLDMDIPASMKAGYEAVEDKLVKGAYLAIHDAVPPQHIPGVHDWFYNEVLAKDRKRWEVQGEWFHSFLTIVKHRYPRKGERK